MSAEPARKPPWPGQPQEASGGAVSVLLSARRTRLSFQRTRMSADRTLMSIIRTALSLIGFGFTIFQFFHYLRESITISVKAGAARNFGIALVLLGVLLLTTGIISHVRFMLELRSDHTQLVEEDLIPRDRFPLSVTLVTALMLLVIGLLAIVSMTASIGPF